MSDLIEREYLLNIARQEEAYGYVSEHEILNAPTAEPKVGRWIEKEDGLEGQYWDCSVCGISWAFNDSGTPSEHGVNYCPNCGAKMERRDDEHTD